MEVAASPEVVWQLVSDLPGMGRFSPENQGGHWAGGAQGPAVGAEFVGRNAQGRRRWSTRSRVTAAEPGRTFAFAVRSGGLRVATWRYDVEAVGDGTRLTETWQDERGRLMAVLGRAVTGVQDRAAYARESMEVTLRRVKDAAEGNTPSR